MALMRVICPQGISKRVASFRLIRRTVAWRQYRLICSMDGQLFRTTERGIHGGSRRGIEGSGERTRSLGPSYPSDWQLSRTPSHRYTSETEKAETDSFGRCTQEDFARAKGTMGKDQADLINVWPNNKPKLHAIRFLSDSCLACARVRLRQQKMAQQTLNVRAK